MREHAEPVSACMHACKMLAHARHRGMHAGVKYVEGPLPASAGLASLLDQLALLQFLLGRLPEAEATARRLLGVAEGLFSAQEPAAAMCSLRLGAVLAGAHGLPANVTHALAQHS